MIENRVGELRLRVRTDLPDSAGLRPAAERMVGAALERCAALLEQRMPGRVVLVRRLPMRWLLDESALDDAAQVDELAREAADAIERMLIPSRLESSASGEAVVFGDEAGFRASHLLALARGRSAWFHATLEEPGAGDPLAALAAPERRATAHATLAHLARENVLAKVLAAQSPAAVAVLAAALGCGGLPPAPGETEDTEVDPQPVAAGNSSIVAELAAIAADWPALPSTARSLALRVHAAVRLDVGMDTSPAIALAAAVEAGSVSPAEPAPPPHRAAAMPEERKSTEGRDPPVRPHEPAETMESVETSEFPATRCAGLFYLLDRVQELDLAESLWKACLPEGTVLAAAARALLGPAGAGDIAPALFGGVEGTAACPEVAPEQHAEVAVSTCSALAAALPRRGLADLPPATVALVGHGAGRLLVAAAEGSPFAFFAWPAATPAMLTAGLGALLNAWPHRGALAAAPALAGLDTSGRLRPHREVEPMPLLLPSAPSPETAALLALVAGAPCLLFAARAGAPSPATVPAFVARYLARPAHLRLVPEKLDVIFGPDDPGLDVRRAGLDRDPGWLPWLGRDVRFVYREREPAGNPLPGGEAR